MIEKSFEDLIFDINQLIQGSLIDREYKISIKKVSQKPYEPYNENCEIEKFKIIITGRKNNEIL